MEAAVDGDLVVDGGPFLLAQRWVCGQGQPHLRVGVHGERAALGRPEVRAARDCLAHLRVRTGGKADHHVGGQTGVGGDEHPVRLVRIREGAVHDGPAEGSAHQPVAASVEPPLRGG